MCSGASELEKLTQASRFWWWPVQTTALQLVLMRSEAAAYAQKRISPVYSGFHHTSGVDFEPNNSEIPQQASRQRKRGGTLTSSEPGVTSMSTLNLRPAFFACSVRSAHLHFQSSGQINRGAVNCKLTVQRDASSEKRTQVITKDT